MALYSPNAYLTRSKHAPNSNYMSSNNPPGESDSFILADFDIVEDEDLALSDTHSTLDKSALERDQW
jgi:hypothetical protein